MSELPNCPLCGATTNSGMINAWHDANRPCRLTDINCSHSEWIELVSLLRDGMAVRDCEQSEFHTEMMWNRFDDGFIGWQVSNGIEYEAPTLHEAVTKAKEQK